MDFWALRMSQLLEMVEARGHVMGECITDPPAILLDHVDFATAMDCEFCDDRLIITWFDARFSGLGDILRTNCPKKFAATSRIGEQQNGYSSK